MTLRALHRAAAPVLCACALATAPPHAAGAQALGAQAVVRQAGSVTGTAWYRDNTPVAHGLLQLRDVATGRVLASSRADAQGRFTFPAVAPGVYVVELVNDDGGVRGVGQVFSVSAGETVATFIRIGTEVPWYSGFFTSAAAGILATAASLGVTAMGDGGQPASPRN
jgi:hypothetical protein